MGTEDGRTILRVTRADAPKVTTRMLRDLPVADLTIEDPPIEDVIEHVFATARATTPPQSRRGGRAGAPDPAPADTPPADPAA